VQRSEVLKRKLIAGILLGKVELVMFFFFMGWWVVSYCFNAELSF
jgi:hypothetical protein